MSLYTAFQLQGALAPNISDLLACRLLTGIFGSSRKCLSYEESRFLVPISPLLALTNAGGTVTDIWSFKERGLASAIYATVPFLGPGKPSQMRSQIKYKHPHTVIGPIVGGFVVQNIHLNWRFNFWLMFIFSAIEPHHWLFLHSRNSKRNSNFQGQPFDPSL
jgi:MFS family permease